MVLTWREQHLTWQTVVRVLIRRNDSLVSFRYDSVHTTLYNSLCHCWRNILYTEILLLLQSYRVQLTSSNYKYYGCTYLIIAGGYFTLVTKHYDHTLSFTASSTFRGDRKYECSVRYGSGEERKAHLSVTGKSMNELV